MKASNTNLAWSKFQIFLTPHGGSHYGLVASIEDFFYYYTDATRKILGFDKYEDISAKDNGRMWVANEVVINYEIVAATRYAYTQLL